MLNSCGLLQRPTTSVPPPLLSSNSECDEDMSMQTHVWNSVIRYAAGSLDGWVFFMVISFKPWGCFGVRALCTSSFFTYSLVSGEQQALFFGDISSLCSLCRTFVHILSSILCVICESWSQTLEWIWGIGLIPPLNNLQLSHSCHISLNYYGGKSTVTAGD